MQEATVIRILEKENNRRGDLFGLLMTDLFVALGYEPPRLNVHKPGRELDLSADHRLEPRRAFAECKATAKPIGGADLNKFVGVLDAEHKKKRPATGYFISLAGFTEAAIEQEKKRRRRTKIILLTGPEVVAELVRGRILIEKDRATELAGRLCATLDHLVLDLATELFAHERGWMWAVYYTQGKARTHVALIQSDGTPLARSLAEEVVAADGLCGGGLHKLTCLNPLPMPGVDDAPRVADALGAYRQYLENECGFIQLDGLPADSDVGSRRLRLQNLFVPLHLALTVTVGKATKEIGREAISAVLAEFPRLAILAAPGGGKSTLIKSLAVDYGDPSRHNQIITDLPQSDWLPLFFRCRELRGLARGSFAELLEALSQREPVRQHAAVFRASVDRALLAGRVLLLVDGLDEISDQGDRAAFVCTLRAALQAYPDIAMVVTSREAGFRHVAAHLAPICTHATLSPFDEEDIRRLSVAWHREVVGDTEKVRADAEELAATIARNDRIQRLAVNPLLLTTLLLVKRWVGSLPTRRAVLYGKAVEVLLMTWNTEGHEPIPDEEALPQLCYVASSMMIEGRQKISRPRLATLLQEARAALPTELGYVKGTVEEFIHRVEDRSSLLMMTGHDVEDGRLIEFFEFRHLTFQEFLTALAAVEGWHPGRSEKDTLGSVLDPHFEEDAWREVIPLAAVLGGKATEGLIQRLTEKVRDLEAPDQERPDSYTPLFLAFGNCLADEAAAHPETIRAGLREVIRLGNLLDNVAFTPVLAKGKYGPDFREEARKAFLQEEPEFAHLMALLMAVWWQEAETRDLTGLTRAAAWCFKQLKHSDRLSRCEGALCCSLLCYELLKNDEKKLPAFAESLHEGGDTLLPLIFSAEASEQYAAAMALVYLGECRAWFPPVEPNLLGQLFRLWRTSEHAEVRRLSGWALASQPLAPREDGRRLASVAQAEIEEMLQRYEILEDDDKIATLIVVWYRHALPDTELAQRARELTEGVDLNTIGPTLRELLERLGEKS
ncbi:MAG TPA: NACHT domain-containing protein [Thermoanaerobaculia bacterium]|jgi:hypothetical protein|nr:NACHT domain-containing protein [Thermoanaerobaculia bacterium]